MGPNVALAVSLNIGSHLTNLSGDAFRETIHWLPSEPDIYYRLLLQESDDFVNGSNLAGDTSFDPVLSQCG